MPEKPYEELSEEEKQGEKVNRYVDLKLGQERDKLLVGEEAYYKKLEQQGKTRADFQAGNISQEQKDAFGEILKRKIALDGLRQYHTRSFYQQDPSDPDIAKINAGFEPEYKQEVKTEQYQQKVDTSMAKLREDSTLDNIKDVIQSQQGDMGERKARQRELKEREHKEVLKKMREQQVDKAVKKAEAKIKIKEAAHARGLYRKDEIWEDARTQTHQVRKLGRITNPERASLEKEVMRRLKEKEEGK